MRSCPVPRKIFSPFDFDVSRPFLTRALLAAALALTIAPAAGAQNYVARADSLFRSGRVFAAETVYYYAVRRAPRDPAARLALGRYLAARGALKIGAVLMEEARYFGGDVKAVAASLAPVYARLDNYRALVALPGSPLNSTERARAEWLRDHPPAVSGPDSTTIVYVPDSTGLGTLRLTVGGDTIEARIDPRTAGLQLDTSWVGNKAVRHFAANFEADRETFTAVVHQVALGELILTNVPARFESFASRRTARIGLDLLGRLAPTFDPEMRRIVLRRDGRLGETPDGVSHPTLAYPNGIWIVQRGEVWPVGGEPARTLLAGQRWTLHARRGEIIVSPHTGTDALVPSQISATP